MASVPDIVAWADRHIATDTDPDPILFDISLGSKRTRDEIARLLEVIGGAGNRVAAARYVIGHLLDTLEADPSRAREVARKVAELGRRGLLPEHEFGAEPFYIDEYFELEASGTLNPDLTAIGALREYLERQAPKP